MSGKGLLASVFRMSEDDDSSLGLGLEDMDGGDDTLQPLGTRCLLCRVFFLV